LSTAPLGGPDNDLPAYTLPEQFSEELLTSWSVPDSPTRTFGAFVVKAFGIENPPVGHLEALAYRVAEYDLRDEVIIKWAEAHGSIEPVMRGIRKGDRAGTRTSRCRIGTSSQ